MLFLNTVDSHITVALYNLFPHANLLTTLFSFFSLYGNSFFIWIIVAVAAIFLEERKYPGIQKKDVTFLITFLLSFFTTSIVTIVLKEAFQRPRPFTIEIVKAISCNFDYAMPSGHSGAAFAAATVLASYDKKRSFLYYSVALLVCFSRIYLGCHYFLDTVFGALIGYLISLCILKLSKNH